MCAVRGASCPKLGMQCLLVCENPREIFMRAKHVLAITLLSAFCFIPVDASPQSVYGSVRGAVLDASGRPIIGAEVALTSLGKETSFERLTDKSGYYLINE